MRPSAASLPPPPAAALNCRRHSTLDPALGVCPLCLRERLIDIQAAANCTKLNDTPRRRRHHPDTTLPSAAASHSPHLLLYPPPSASASRHSVTGSRRSASSHRSIPSAAAPAPPDASLRLYSDTADPRSLARYHCSCADSDRDHSRLHLSCATTCQSVDSTGIAEDFFDERHMYPNARRRSASPAAASLAPYLQYSGAVLLDQAPFSPSFADRRAMAPSLVSRYNVPPAATATAGSLTCRSQNNYNHYHHSGADPPPRPSIGGLRYVFHSGIENIPASSTPAIFNHQHRITKSKIQKNKKKNKRNPSNVAINANQPFPQNQHHLPSIMTVRQNVDILNPFDINVPPPMYANCTGTSTSTTGDPCDYYCINDNTQLPGCGGVTTTTAHSSSPHWLSTLFGRKKSRHRSKSVANFSTASSSTVNYKTYIMQRASAAAAAEAAHVNSALHLESVAAVGRYSADAAATAGRNVQEEDYSFMSKFPSLFTTTSPAPPNNQDGSMAKDQQLTVSSPPFSKNTDSDARVSTIRRSHNKKLLDFLRVDTRDVQISKCGRIDPQQPPPKFDGGAPKENVGIVAPTDLHESPTILSFHPKEAESMTLPDVSCRRTGPCDGPQTKFVNCRPSDAAASVVGVDNIDGRHGSEAVNGSDQMQRATAAAAAWRNNTVIDTVANVEIPAKMAVSSLSTTFTDQNYDYAMRLRRGRGQIISTSENVASASAAGAAAMVASSSSTLRSWGRSLNKKLFMGRRWSRAPSPTTSSSSATTTVAMAAEAATKLVSNADLLRMEERHLKLVKNRKHDGSGSNRRWREEPGDGGGGGGGGDEEAAKEENDEQQQQSRQSSLLNIRDYSAFSFYFSPQGQQQNRGISGGDNMNYSSYYDDNDGGGGRGVLTTMSTPEQMVVLPCHYDNLFQSRHSVDGSSRRL